MKSTAKPNESWRDVATPLVITTNYATATGSGVSGEQRITTTVQPNSTVPKKPNEG